MLVYWRHQPAPPAAFCAVHDLFIYFLFPFFFPISFFYLFCSCYFLFAFEDPADLRLSRHRY